MPFRDLGFNFTYYYFINSLVCVSQNLFCLIGLRPNPLSLEIARISFGSLLAYSRRKVAFIKA